MGSSVLYFFFLSFNPLNEPGPNCSNINQQLVKLKKKLPEEKREILIFAS